MFIRQFFVRNLRSALALSAALTSCSVTELTTLLMEQRTHLVKCFSTPATKDPALPRTLMQVAFLSFSTSSVDSNATDDDEEEDVEGLEVEVSDEELEEVDDGLEAFGDPLWLSDGAGPDPESSALSLAMSSSGAWFGDEFSFEDMDSSTPERDLWLPLSAPSPMSRVGWVGACEAVSLSLLLGSSSSISSWELLDSCWGLPCSCSCSDSTDRAGGTTVSALALGLGVPPSAISGKDEPTSSNEFGEF